MLKDFQLWGLVHFIICIAAQIVKCKPGSYLLQHYCPYYRYFHMWTCDYDNQYKFIIFMTFPCYFFYVNYLSWLTKSRRFYFWLMFCKNINLNRLQSTIGDSLNSIWYALIIIKTSLFELCNLKLKLKLSDNFLIFMKRKQRVTPLQAAVT